MVVGIMDTEHFNFIVFGDTPAQAETLMNKAFAMHLKEYDTSWNEECSPAEYYGTNYTPVVNHAVFKDHDRMKGI